MEDQTKERWYQLCGQAAVEQDPKKALGTGNGDRFSARNERSDLQSRSGLRRMNTTGSPRRATWRDLHRTAITEEDDRKGRITEAYDAIMNRMLHYSMLLSMEETLTNAEYRELTNALNDLRQLRQPQGRSSVSFKLASLPT